MCQFHDESERCWRAHLFFKTKYWTSTICGTSDTHILDFESYLSLVLKPRWIFHRFCSHLLMSFLTCGKRSLYPQWVHMFLSHSLRSVVNIVMYVSSRQTSSKSNCTNRKYIELTVFMTFVSQQMTKKFKKI